MGCTHGFVQVLAAVGLTLSVACVSELDTSRGVPAERDLAREVYGVVCDRVGAQSLREDITGESYQRVCHPDADGGFAEQVDLARLPPLDTAASDDQGRAVAASELESTRARGVARVEALAADRDPLIEAFGAMLPDVTLPSLRSCQGEPRLRDALESSLSGLVPLYEDDTVPALTRALGGLFARIEQEPEIAQALSRMAVREGYRPDALALYVLRPLLSYPRLFELGAALAAVHRDNRHGARDKLQAVLEELAKELRKPVARAIDESEPLVLSTDAVSGQTRISRARSTRELVLPLLTEATRSELPSVLSIVQRDVRGLALVARDGAVLPRPFMADERGEPRIDELGRFMTVDGTLAPRPFGSGPSRDELGRALSAEGRLLYSYLGIQGSVVAELSSSLGPLFVPRADQGSEALMDALALLRPLLAGKGAPQKATAASFAAAESPLVSFGYALASTVTRPEVEDVLVLFEKLSRERPELLAHLVRLVLRLDAIADRYPDVRLRTESTLWDELIDVGIELAQRDGMFEDLFRAFTDARTKKLGSVFAAYMSNRDELTYFRDPAHPDSVDSLNGPVFNLTTGDLSDMKTKVDRAAPDSGNNRSVLQRFLSLLHDANGLTACTKEGAVAHVNIRWNGIPIKLDYPTNPLAKVVCGFLGSSAPERIPECGILRFDDVASLLIKVALRKADIEVRDDCLAKLVASPLADFVGGANAFLEETSGIRGFSLNPSVQGVARLAFFDTPYESWGGYYGDDFYPKTRDFLRDVLDPVPSTVCPVAITADPSDGSPVALRRCERFEDTLRGRDPNGLFPLEQLGFLDAVQPLAEAFDAHEATPAFVHLLDVLHLHWGTPAQTREECDPTLPKSDARWCSQDGVSRYEPMLADMMAETDLFGELAEIATILGQTKVSHCAARADDGSCSSATERDGIAVMADALRGLLDPARSPGLTTRTGRTKALRNDGTEGTALAPVHLWLDALSELRAALEARPEQQKQWLGARSRIVDVLLASEDTQAGPRFRLRAIDAVLPRMFALLREQLGAHCGKERGTECAWAKSLVTDLSDSVSSKLTARLVDTVEALRADDASRTELTRLLAHVTTADEATHASVLAALIDVLQVLADQRDLDPLYDLVAQALAGDGKSNPKLALAPRLLELLSRFFAAPEGDACGTVDPHHAFAFVLARAVEPMRPGARAPVDVLIDSALAVNRKNPRERGALSPADMASVGRELSAFMLDEASGLEQVYAVLRQAVSNGP